MAQYSDNWHIRHLVEPASVKAGSIMPNYPHLLRKPFSGDAVAAGVRAMVTLGVPYTDEEVEQAEALARAQAAEMVAALIETDGPEAVPDLSAYGLTLEETQMIAVVAYLQRLGTDLMNAEPATEDATDVAALPAPEADHAVR